MKKKLIVTGGDDLVAYSKLIASDFDLIPLFPEVGKQLEDLDVPNRSFNTFINEQLQAKANSDIAFALVGIMGQIPQAAERLHPSVRDVFKQVIPGFVLGQAQSLSLLISTLDVVNPDGAIVHNDVEPTNRALALWCQSRGKPCLHVPHAIYMNYGRGAVGSDVHDLITASHITVAGPFQRDWYIQRGFPEDRIAVTGVPRFDRIIHLPVNRERACSVLKLDYKKPTIVYFSSWGQRTNLLGCNNEVEEKYLMFLEAMKGYDDVEFIISCHPRGRNVQWHAQEAHKRGLRCIVTDQYLDLVDQVMTAGICYGPSNVILSLSLFGKPLAVLGGFEEDNEILKIPPDVDSIRKSFTALMAADKPNYTNFWLKYIGVPDGLASQRVASYIRKVFC